jgi:hypothetical protein
MERIDGVVVGSIRMIGDTVWLVAGEYYGDNELYAAYRYRKSTGESTLLMGGVDYDRATDVISLSMIGIGVK